MTKEVPDFEHIGAQVLEELNNRLGSPELARDLPGTLLMKIAERYLVYLERKQAFLEAQMKDQDKQTDPLSAIDQPGLPEELRKDLLLEYVGECRERWHEAADRYKERYMRGVADEELPEELTEA